jgi:hypothetical protein
MNQLRSTYLSVFCCPLSIPYSSCQIRCVWCVSSRLRSQSVESHLVCCVLILSTAYSHARTPEQVQLDRWTCAPPNQNDVVDWLWLDDRLFFPYWTFDNRLVSDYQQFRARTSKWSCRTNSGAIPLIFTQYAVPFCEVSGYSGIV